MSYSYPRRLWIGVMTLALCSPLAGVAQSPHPLEPLDLSSPRATLNNFLAMGDAFASLLGAGYWNAPSRAGAARVLALSAQQERTLDLSGIPPAARTQMGHDGIAYLYEVLSRIELPPEADIPDAAALAAAGDDERADDKAARWTIPHTEITLVRVADGPRAGEFLFSSSTVARAKEFHEKTRTLPYRRDVPIKNYAEKRPYLSITGWMISSRTIEGFPNWLKRPVYEQGVWKWIALTILIAMTVVVVVVIHRLARRGLSGHSAGAYLRRLTTPVALWLLVPLVLDLANRQLTLTGWVSGGLTLAGEAITYFALAWIAWTGSIAVAEAFIASPKTPDQSLNAHLLRLAARTFGLTAVIVIIFYVSNQLGVPLYGLIAGLGVGGIAVALAAQSTIENFIGGLNLFLDRPVGVGDFCRYGEDPTLHSGTVESIGLRSTQIRGVDDTVTTIPNAEFSKMQIVNYAERRSRLLSTVLGLRHETTDDQLRSVLAGLREMLLAHPRVVDDEPRVRFAGFGEFALNVVIRVHIGTSDSEEFYAIREEIYLRAREIVKDTGTDFALPWRARVYSRDSGSGVTQEGGNQ